MSDMLGSTCWMGIVNDDVVDRPDLSEWVESRATKKKSETSRVDSFHNTSQVSHILSLPSCSVYPQTRSRVQMSAHSLQVGRAHDTVPFAFVRVVNAYKISKN